MTDEEARSLQPQLVYVDERNQVTRIGHEIAAAASH